MPESESDTEHLQPWQEPVAPLRHERPIEQSMAAQVRTVQRLGSKSSAEATREILQIISDPAECEQFVGEFNTLLGTKGIDPIDLALYRRTAKDHAKDIFYQMPADHEFTLGARERLVNAIVAKIDFLKGRFPEFFQADYGTGQAIEATRAVIAEQSQTSTTNITADKTRERNPLGWLPHGHLRQVLEELASRRDDKDYGIGLIMDYFRQHPQVNSSLHLINELNDTLLQVHGEEIDYTAFRPWYERLQLRLLADERTKNDLPQLSRKALVDLAEAVYGKMLFLLKYGEKHNV